MQEIIRPPSTITPEAGRWTRAILIGAACGAGAGKIFFEEVHQVEASNLDVLDAQIDLTNDLSGGQPSAVKQRSLDALEVAREPYAQQEVTDVGIGTVVGLLVAGSIMAVRHIRQRRRLLG